MVSTSTTTATRSSGTTGDEVKTGTGTMGIPCSAEGDGWELQCFAGC
jgi:hypothetical protein